MRVSNISAQNNIYRNQNITANRKNNANPSFKGDGIFKQMATAGYKGVSEKGWFQKFVNTLSKSDKSFTGLMIAESCLLSGFYMFNTIRNKKIDKEQKPQMLVNDALVLGVSSVGAWSLDDKVSKAWETITDKTYFSKRHIQEYYKKLGKKAQEALGANSDKAQLLDEVSKGAEAVSAKIGEQLKGVVGKAGELKLFEISPDQLIDIQTKAKEAVSANSDNLENAKAAVKGCIDSVYDNMAAKNEIAKIMPGVNKIKTLIIFGLIYRYLGPVVVTPLANKISAKFFDKKADKLEQTTQKK